MTLHNIRSRRPSTLPLVKIYNFEQRAAQILQGWEQVLIEDVKSSNRRWALNGPHEVSYVPRDDRKSPASLFIPFC